MLAVSLLFLLASTLSTETLIRELKNGLYLQVVEESQELLKDDPDNATVCVLRGLALSKLERHSESLEAFIRALKITPKSLPALEGATQEAYRLRDSTATSLVNRMLSLDPDNAPAHAIAGVLDVEAKNCTSAITHFEKGISVMQEDALALTQYGACLIAQDQPKPAIKLLQHAISIQPNSSAANYDLAVALFESGDITSAVAILDKLPVSSDVLNLRAECLVHEDKVEEAIAGLRKAIELAPGDERNYLDLASLCVDHSSYDLGIEIATIGLKNLPNSAKLLTLRGAIRTLQGNDDAAAADFEQATTLQPTEDFGSIGLSLMLQGSARSDEAETILRNALKAHPNDPGLLYLLGDLLLRKASGSEDRQQAFKCFSEAARLRPSFAKPHAALGKLYLLSGNAEKAIEELQKAIQLAPEDHMALHQLVLAYRHLGLEAQATETAVVLRRVLDDERKQEVSKNRIRLSASSETTRN